MSANPIFDTLAAEYPGIHRASDLFPEPAPEPYITFIRERGLLQDARDIITYAVNFMTPRTALTPSNAPELWP